eukprot:scaffold988_cov105-Isochrysis_galbana.AAC.8
MPDLHQPQPEFQSKSSNSKPSRPLQSQYQQAPAINHPNGEWSPLDRRTALRTRSSDRRRASSPPPAKRSTPAHSNGLRAEATSSPLSAATNRSSPSDDAADRPLSRVNIAGGRHGSAGLTAGERHGSAGLSSPSSILKLASAGRVMLTSWCGRNTVGGAASSALAQPRAA